MERPNLENYHQDKTGEDLMNGPYNRTRYASDLEKYIDFLEKQKSREPTVFSGGRRKIRENLWNVLNELQGNTANAYYDIIDIFVPIMRARIASITIEDLVLDRKNIIEGFIYNANICNEYKSIMHECLDDYLEDCLEELKSQNL